MYVLFFFFFKQKTAYEMLRSLVGSEMCIRDSSIGVPLPLTASVMEIMHSLYADGLAEEDHCSIIKFYEKIANIKVGN